VVLVNSPSGSLTAFYGVFAMFPVLAITLVLGGVTPGEFWRMTHRVREHAVSCRLRPACSCRSISRLEQRAMAGTFLLLLLVMGCFR